MIDDQKVFEHFGRKVSSDTTTEETENYKKLRDAIIGSLTRKLYLTIPPVESFSELLNYKEAQSWLDTFQLLQKWTESESLDLYFLHVHRDLFKNQPGHALSLLHKHLTSSTTPRSELKRLYHLLEQILQTVGWEEWVSELQSMKPIVFPPSYTLY